jgi:excisionase family DNA binding protein
MAMKIDLNKLITAEQLAERLGVKIRTVYSWTSGRKISYTRHRRRVYFDVGVVEKMLQRNAVEALATTPVQHSRAAQEGVQAEGEQTE